MTPKDAKRLQALQQSARHQLLMKAFERLNAPGDPWMSAGSENDPDVLIHMGHHMREAVTVYCFGDRDHWTVLGSTKIVGMIAGRYSQLFYDEITGVASARPGEPLSIDEILFWVPASLTSKIVELVNLVLNQNQLDLAEIAYDSGAIRFRYARYLAEDGTRWLRHGPFRHYYPDGSLASDGQYLDGLEQGLWQDFHLNGVLAAEGRYKDGEKIGVWRFWGEDGVLAERLDHADGS